MNVRKVQFGTQLPRDVLDQVRATVRELQRDDPSLTIARFTELALVQAMRDPDRVVGDSSGITPGLRPGRRIRDTAHPGLESR